MIETNALLAAIPWTWALDGWIVLAGMLCAVAAALPGNFLLLRKMSMLGDAISHAILPGLAIAFFLSESRSSVPMFAGAVIVGVLTALFTEWIRGFGEVDEGASMGVVFTTLFALGLVMIVQAADHVDLDPSCVLYGAIELTPLDTVSVLGHQIPRVVATLSVVLTLNLIFVSVFYKELQICSFDPALATASGFHARLMHYLLMILVAVTAVASFESVGNILVVAMFVVPPATARLLTDRLGRMILISMFIAAVSAVLGHISAITLPRYFGFNSASTAGMMALAAGLLFALAALFGPQQGVVVRMIRQQLLGMRILSEDLIALLYRMEERSDKSRPSQESLQDVLLSGPWITSLLMYGHRLRGLVSGDANAFSLTESGRQLGVELVRSHRLWESYLVERAGIRPDHVHDRAMLLEHFTTPELSDRLAERVSDPATDPHGRSIPGRKD
ncbi:MAG: metal ABC transporter permease [Bdellovibrionales bacterium]|nr:metal ABC transporter permease [Bdellovibrionales bacterium]